MVAVTGPLPHRARSVSGDVAAYLRRFVGSSLAAGDRLPSERELADQLGVSRTTVREAMAELQRDRLVDRRPGRGTVVLGPPPRTGELARRLDPRDLDDDALAEAQVAELRRVVEPQLAGLAAARATDADLVALEAALAEAHTGLSPLESSELDLRFHVLVARAGGNPLLVTLCELAGTWTLDVRRRSHATRAGRRTSARGHRAILDAVAAGDPATAVQAMSEHLGDVETAIGVVR